MKRIILTFVVIINIVTLGFPISAWSSPSPVALQSRLHHAPQQAVTPSEHQEAFPKYHVVDLGPLPSVSDDVNVSINSLGQVSLWSDAPNQTIQAARWSEGKLNLLGDVHGYPNSISHGINDAGEIVGWANTSANCVDSLSTTRALVVRKDRSFLLGTLGGRDSRAFSVNSAGQIAGDSTLAGGDRHAFLFDKNHMLDLGTLLGGRFSQAYGVNDTGDVAGVSDTDHPFKHAVLWRSGHAVDLGTLPGGTTSSAQAINDQDQVAGFSDMPSGTHAFLYQGGRMQDLGTLGTEPSNACGINNHGQVVGASNISPFQRHAFLWQNGRMADLNSLVERDWVLSRAGGINDRGQIVCLGHETGMPSQPVHVLLLTPITQSRSGSGR